MPLPTGLKLLVNGLDIAQAESDLNLELTEVSPGGSDKLTFNMCDLEPPEFTVKVQLVDINARNPLVYAGRVSDVKLNKDGAAVTCESQGVWTTDRKLIQPITGTGDQISFKYQSGAKVTDVVRDLFGRLCPDIIGPESILDSALQLAEPSPDFAGQTFQSVMSWATGLTSFLGTPLTWHIRNGGMEVKFLDDSARLTIEYNDTFETEFNDQDFTNTSTVEWGKDQIFTVPEITEGILYDVLKCIRDRYNNVSNEVRLLNDAKALAYAYFSRFNEWRSTRDSITIDCESGQEVVAVAPITTSPMIISPWLVPVGYGCRINNIPTRWGRYATPNVKYLVNKRYNFKTGKLDLQFGRPNGLSEAIRLITAFEVNRPTVVVEAIGGNNPLVNQDTTPTFGPSFSTTAVKDPSLQAGIPIFATQGEVDGTKPANGGWVHPNVVADEGLEANFNIGDLTTEGFKGGIRVIPGEFNEIEVLLGSDAGLIHDSCFVKLYKLDKGTGVTPIEIAQLPITQKRTLLKLPAAKTIVLGPRAWILPQVITPSTNALWASVSLHAVRDYPDLKLT